jgi:starch-binding outer membrane protein, SusD/RagB family
MKHNMKNRIRIGVVGSFMACIFLMYSCKDDFLVVPVTGQLDANLLASKIGLDAALISAYSQVNGRGNRMASPSNWVWGSIRGGDANKGTDPGDFSDINPIQRYEALPTQGVISDKYNGNYELVARANAVLKLLKTADPAVTAADKLAIEAQAKFLRGHGYFELKRGFGDTPYIDETIDVTTDAAAGVASGSEKVKNDVDLWPKIEADFQFAVTNLPATQGQVGRVNSWAAKAYLAKVYMYQNKFAAAKTLFDDIIANGRTSNDKKYGLVPKYADVFKASNDNHEESVWAYQAAAGTGSVNNANPEFDLNWPYNTGADGPGNCCSFFQPTFEMANSFYTEGGLPKLDGSYNSAANSISTDMGVESGALWKALDDKGVEIEYKKDQAITQIDPAKPFQSRAYVALVDNKSKDPLTNPAVWKLVWVESVKADGTDIELDPRIDHSIGRRGVPYLDWQPFPGKAWIRNQPNAGPYQTKKYAYYKSDKGSLQDNSSWTPGYTAINYTIIRYADVLLMAAEAEIEVGSLTTALDYINQVRNRAANAAGFVMDGAVPAANYVIAPYATLGTQANARAIVRMERKLELSGEGHRFYDLMRWGADGKTLIKAFIAYEKDKYPSGAYAGISFTDGQDELLPIPQNQIDLLGSDILKQNPGYSGN